MKAKITYSYPRVIVRKNGAPLIREVKVGEIVDALVKRAQDTTMASVI